MTTRIMVRFVGVFGGVWFLGFFVVIIIIGFFFETGFFNNKNSPDCPGTCSGWS